MKTLGDGNFAVVKQARQKSTDHEYAIKVIDKSKMKVILVNLYRFKVFEILLLF